MERNRSALRNTRMRRRAGVQSYLYVQEIYNKELTLPWVIKQRNAALPVPYFSVSAVWNRPPAPETSKDWMLKTATHNTTGTMEQKENFTINIGEHTST
jgi:hypothetical protein